MEHFVSLDVGRSLNCSILCFSFWGGGAIALALKRLLIIIVCFVNVIVVLLNRCGNVLTVCCCILQGLYCMRFCNFLVALFRCARNAVRALLHFVAALFDRKCGFCLSVFR